MPPDRSVFAVGQRFDIRVEAASDDPAGPPPRELRVTLDDRDLTPLNILDVGMGRQRGAGGAGATGRDLPAHHRASRAPAHTTNFLLRDYSFPRPGTYVIHAETADGTQTSVTVSAVAWDAPRAGGRRARNIILLLGDGMGLAHRTAARILARGVTEGKADGLLAMDTMEATGLVMTFSLNAVITDSAPGMSALVTGQKANNNQVGVYPDNTLEDSFDNPRVEYIGELLRRIRGTGFNVGLVTTSDVTDATPAGNAVHTADRNDGPGIATQYFDERHTNAVSVLMGGGRRHFQPQSAAGSSRNDERHLIEEYRQVGYRYVTTSTELRALLAAPKAPGAILGLFHPRHLPVAFDKVGAGRYSEELAQEPHAGLRDQPMLDDMTRLALRSLEQHSSAGFFLMVEGASIDKQAHAIDAERTVWDTIEFDNAVQVALDFAARTNTDDDPDNDTLVIVAADHETGGLAIIGVGNEHYAPAALGRAVRDYAAVFRFAPEQVLNFFPNYERDAAGFPRHPDPSRKLLLGWAAAPDRYENWISNRLALDPAVLVPRPGAPPDAGRASRMAVANPARSGPDAGSDNRTVDARPIPGFLVPGLIENAAEACPAPEGCPADTAAMAQTIGGHTASDVPLSASGPGALQFTGTYDNTEVFIKMLQAVGGSYATELTAPPRQTIDLRELGGRRRH